MKQGLWPALLLLVAIQLSQARAEDLVTPFRLETAAGVIVGEVHSIKGEKPDTVIAIVGGSNYRIRADAAAALPLFVSSQTAVALYDRRGSGASTGKYEIPTTENTAWLVPELARDAAAVASHLKSQGFRRVALIGTSMGGWIAVAAAAKSQDIHAIVCVNGGASTVGVSDAFDALIAKKMSIAEATAALRRYHGPTGYDPHPDLAAMRQPAFWIFGELDDSNPTVLDSETVRAFQARGKGFRLFIVPGANHDLVDVKSGKFNDSWVEPVRRFVRGN